MCLGRRHKTAPNQNNTVTGLLSVRLPCVAPGEHGRGLDGRQSGGQRRGDKESCSAVVIIFSSYYTRIILSSLNNAIIKFGKLYL